jgi:Holliday junction DNA helicase RuvA
MFNSLNGKVSGRSADTLYLLTGGVEWEIVMPLTDLDTMEMNGGETKVFTYLHHTEKDMRIFGFSDTIRRKTFLELQKVEGIGPRAAIKIMSGISQTELERALEEGDVARLERTPGLGKKTAQKMVLALKGKLISGGTEKAASASPYGELVNALTDMGYDRKSAETALEKAAAEIRERGGNGKDNRNIIEENELFRLAIHNLTK